MSAGDLSSTPPDPAEIEVAMLGPGYGESILIHTGDGEWVVVDSFLNPDHRPSALAYLERLGYDPATAIRLIVATHWHDDHIRGMGTLVESGRSARFCCAGTLRRLEFLSMIEGFRAQGSRAAGFGTREIFSVFAHLGQVGVSPLWATASRRVHRSPRCDVWSLSPDDEAYTSFLESLAPPSDAEPERVFALPTPNQLSVALLVHFDGGVSCLLGADLERRGWTTILNDDRQPRCRSSVFKVPHHGSANAHLEGVWDELLEPEPFAILAPWRRGGGSLPRKGDVNRILAHTPNAYATTKEAPGAAPRDRWVKKKLRVVNAKLQPESGTTGMIRLRRSMTGESSWRVKLFGSACHLEDFAA